MKLYNTISHRVEPLIINQKKITLYVCGITPYDTTHLGHAFIYVIFDTLVRFLKWRGYQVSYTQNVTDVDNPLFERARELGVNWNDLAEKWTKRFLGDMRTLNVAPPDYFPKVTQEIPMIIRMVNKLVNKGIAYKKKGNVYFNIKKDPNYGKLSRLNEKRMTEISRKRGGNPDDPKKKHPLDFLLWQTSKEDEPRWDSPWGEGRPGWHIECSAMSIKYLGEQLTIHGGGKDLIFPHHESEIAQSENYSQKKPFVHHWMHIGMVSYQGKKMSKSLGNLILVHHLTKQYSPFAIRWYLLSHHYRKNWEFSEKELGKVQSIAQSIKNILKLPKAKENSNDLKYLQDFTDVLENDFDTPKALQIILHLALQQKKRASPLLSKMLNILGL